jgi:hypothetical protein
VPSASTNRTVVDMTTSSRPRSFFLAMSVTVLAVGAVQGPGALAASKTPVGRVGTACTKVGAAGKTAKGTALVCNRTSGKLRWALAPKTKTTTKPPATKSADTTVPKAKTADTTVPKAKTADTTVPKPKAADTTVPKRT